MNIFILNDPTSSVFRLIGLENVAHDYKVGQFHVVSPVELKITQVQVLTSIYSVNGYSIYRLRLMGLTR